MSTRRSLVASALLAALVQSSFADFDAGLTAHRAGDHGKAHDRWEECAVAGQARCQFALGALYDDGVGVTADTARALLWYERAARQDLPDAIMQLGFLYATGRDGLEQDPVRAWAWFARGAGLGIPGAREHRDRVGGLLTAEELTRAQALADQLSIRYHLQPAR